jgi:RNA recognition motif-containing protein
MQCIINSAIALMKGEPAQCQQGGVLLIAVAAFILGALAAFIVGKLACRSAKARNKNSQTFKRDKVHRFEKSHPPPADGSIEIYVGNLSYDLTEDILRKEFEAYGKVNSARIITNRFNNKSKGFGFVHMPNREEADAAIKGLFEKEILGRKLRCNEAKNVAN